MVVNTRVKVIFVVLVEGLLGLWAVRSPPRVRDFFVLWVNGILRTAMKKLILLNRLSRSPVAPETRCSAITPSWSPCTKSAKCTFACLARIAVFTQRQRMKRHTAKSLRCPQDLKFENFTSSFGRLRQNIAPKSVPHVQHDYFVPHSTNQITDLWRCHLPSLLLKLPTRV